jgi:hypothetical protein
LDTNILNEHGLIMEPLRVTASYPHQAGDGFFVHCHEAGRGTDATAFVERAKDIFRCALRQLGIA